MATDLALILPETTDVLVVGYGPVGATIACLLGRYGVHAVVVDKATEMLMIPRAIALDNEAQRTLQIAGIGDAAFPKLAIPVCRLLSPYVGEFGAFETGGVIDGYPKLVTFYQPDLEQALRNRAAQHAHVQTAPGVELLTLTEGPDAVRATLRDTAGRTFEIAARYVIGADGASSRVRALVGQEFTGHSYAEDWLIVDARNTERPTESVEFHCQRYGASPHLPAPGGRERWEFMLDPTDSPEEMLRDERIKTLLAPWGDPADMTIERKAVYRFHARCCERFRVGRVFLAGDAAHVTPPFVGQGLVSGLRDAANLCWKLAWVLRGHAATSILDSYDQERRPHARAMIDFARFLGAFIMPRRPWKAILLHGLMRTVRAIPPFRRFLDEMRIKPRHRYPEGLFHAGGDRLERGSWLPQAWVRAPNGETLLSDDALGDHVTLVGFGVDPRAHLTESTLAAWQATGGRVIQIALRAQLLGRTPDAYEDLTGALTPDAAPFGWAAIIRPDRTILHDGPATEAERLVAECRALLGTAGPEAIEPRGSAPPAVTQRPAPTRDMPS